MAYYTGTANTLNDLKGTLTLALTGNGWSQDGEILSKGGTFISLTVGAEDPLVPDTRLILSMGNSVLGGVLQDTPLSPRIGPLRDGSGQYNTWTWPVQYHIHVLPTEVYLLVNHDGVWWQHLAFGRSPTPGNPGTGNWLYASFPHPGRSHMNSIVEMSPDGGSMSTYRSVNRSPLPFFWTGGKDNSYPSLYMNAQIHGCTDINGETKWSDREFPGFYTTASMTGVTSGPTMSPLFSLQPNAWNSESTLLPIQIFQHRLENKVSLVGELVEARFIRNDFLPDGEIVTVGGTRWKVYSAYRRNTAARNGGRSNHSGTFAIAIRYDGP